MRPSLSVDDGLNGIPANGVVIGHSVTRNALGVSCSYFENLSFGQLGLRALGASSVLSVLSEDTTEDSAGVKDIFTEGNDFKVLNPVVVFDPVDVVDNHIGWDRSAEKLIDEPVDFQRLNIRRSRSDGNDIVSIFVYTAADNLPSFADYSA